MQDQLKDHAYDGIQEYDNPLPGWWVGLFWASAAFAGLYLFYDSARPEFGVSAEYEAEMQVWYDEQTRQLLAMGEIDEFKLATVMQNKNAMKEAAKTFQKSCKLCHKADASGDIGPNLTDEYWLHGNTMTEIYSVIKDGRNKMPPWAKKMSPAMVVYMAAYVGTLRGQNLPGKPPLATAKKLPPAEVPDLRKGPPGTPTEGAPAPQ